MEQFMSPDAQLLIIAAATTKVAYSCYKYFTRHERQAARIVDSTQLQVEQVIDEVTNGIDFAEDVLLEQCTDVIDTTVMEVSKRRRVRAKAPFRAYLVRCGKAKFGSLKRTTANIMCVRKYLYDLCVEHGVLARHISENLDFATMLVFVPMKDDLRAHAIMKTLVVSEAFSVAKLLGFGSESN
jgi:hypothetical protein